MRVWDESERQRRQRQRPQEEGSTEAAEGELDDRTEMAIEMAALQIAHLMRPLSDGDGDGDG